MLANYQSITFTCILCKVLKHIMASHVVEHMHMHVLYDLQHSFREEMSWETQLTMLVEDLARSTSAGNKTDLILLHFQKCSIK